MKTKSSSANLQKMDVKLPAKYNPDEACQGLGFCFTDTGEEQCHLFPKPKVSRVFNARRKRAAPNICELPGIKEICKLIDKIFDGHMPAVDIDGDRFSVMKTFRGTSWRGKDCDDGSKDIHPGSRPHFSDVNKDTNCNGIYGSDSSGNAYEDQLIFLNSQQRGAVVLGDSISAHFHLPREWFNTTEMSVVMFEPLLNILENELDWPELSSTTGFIPNPYPLINHGPTDSIYMRLKARNRCNHRDYQNIAVNVYFVTQQQITQHPDTIDHMTKPEQMKNNSLTTLKYLDQTLPKGSHVFLTALADGRVLYDSLHTRIHPIGSLRNDVTYANFYDYFNCLQVSPCTGWMNSNETMRNLTTDRANELNSILQQLSTEYQPKNYKLYYIDNPINQVLNEYEKNGGQKWELLEPVDGFHSNQIGQALTAKVVWENLETNYPDVLGPENPNNSKIEQIFGSQGGY
ncbi:AOAH [Mytilus edulis]|uniref:AOAH n=1 Tax=Mytilus edulis TaxID=6550 RepID=A0A8S3R4K0_MYTED|nr:AOAH [Mytilus edulis]